MMALNMSNPILNSDGTQYAKSYIDIFKNKIQFRLHKSYTDIFDNRRQL